MTAFSDLPHKSECSVFMSGEQVRSYLESYALQFGLKPDLRLEHCVTSVSRKSVGSGYIVRYRTPQGDTREELFTHVVVASGRHRTPAFPDIPGLESFNGAGGLSHTFAYRDAQTFKGKRVVVAGCSVSALEIAGELAQRGDVRVISSSRRQRYVLNKMIAGVPADHCVFTRYSALAAEFLPLQTVCDELSGLIDTTSGNPRNWGARLPFGNIIEAGVTLNQNFLPLVADGRIECKPWIQHVNGNTVHFEDGSDEVVDAIVLGTGYTANLEYLASDLRIALGMKHDKGPQLYRHTFHPDVPDFAFAGFYDLLGPYFPVVELQARWIAYKWSGTLRSPSGEEMRKGLTRCPVSLTMQSAALAFAREAGVEPNPEHFPDLRALLLFGPLLPISFRLSGRDSLPDAQKLIVQQVGDRGAHSMTELSSSQRSKLDLLASARNRSINEQAPRRLAARVL
jgi:cation diffusion facilitator CzcD-associated flavoprotein CzcO